MDEDNNEFKFSLNDKVIIVVSGEDGEVVGQARYPNQDNSYLIRYKAGDGRGVESWWTSAALKAVEVPPALQSV